MNTPDGPTVVIRRRAYQPNPSPLQVAWVGAEFEDFAYLKNEVATQNLIDQAKALSQLSEAQPEVVWGKKTYYLVNPSDKSGWLNSEYAFDSKGGRYKLRHYQAIAEHETELWDYFWAWQLVKAME